MMGNEAIRDREYQRDVMEVGAPVEESDWPDMSRCASCGKEFGLTLESAMRSRWISGICADCEPQLAEMCDDSEDQPYD